jgi:hypothetical protein
VQWLTEKKENLSQANLYPHRPPPVEEVTLVGQVSSLLSLQISLTARHFSLVLRDTDGASQQQTSAHTAATFKLHQLQQQAHQKVSSADVAGSEVET